MQITLHGAAGEVTGSAYHVQTDQASVLVDFGLFQGREMVADANRVPDALAPRQLNGVVLTHAHLDHVGRLPLLTRAGYRGPVYATPATLELTRLILEDSAKVQDHDLQRTNRKLAAQGKPPRAPLYTAADVAEVVKLFQPLPYTKPTTIAAGIRVSMFEAGHILGSASIEMEIGGNRQPKFVLFSGDIGPRGAPILQDAACLTRANVVFLESTYGDRDHRSLADTVAEFRDLVRDAVRQRGKILVPTFAVGRAQQVLYHLAEMFDEQLVSPFPIVVDSPMAIEATRIYASHPELYDEDMQRMTARNGLAKRLEAVQYSVTAEDSKALNDLAGPCLIMAGAGMCHAGRIVHHLRHNLAHPGTVVLVVGFQAPGSLGRQLIDGAKEVSIFGETIPVRATVKSLGGFSAHAGQSDLLEWLACPAPQRPQIVLTHGEDKGRIPLARLIKQRYGLESVLPSLGDVIKL